jgi:hypothetical protein
VEAMLQLQELHQLSLVHAPVFQAKPSGDEDTCLPISSPSRARDCAVALLPPPVTFLSSCPRAVTLSGPRSEVSCARACCNTLGGIIGDRIGGDFLHQWCPGRATVLFGRRSFDAGLLLLFGVLCILSSFLEQL